MTHGKTGNPTLPVTIGPHRIVDRIVADKAGITTTIDLEDPKNSQEN